jgi:fatty-acyl-CoA synthase
VLFFREEEVAVTGNAKIKAGELRELAANRLRARRVKEIL